MPLATKNTLSDVIFAEQYVEFLSRRASTPEARARAKIMLATMTLLDRSMPSWRTELLAALNDAEHARDIAEIFPVPENFGGSLLSEFLDTAMKGPKP